MPRPGWSGKADQNLIRMYEYGFGLEEMATELGVPAEEVNQRLRELDRRPRPVPPRLSDESEGRQGH